MNRFRTLLAGALVALALAGGYALAQISNLTPTSLSGGETIVVAALGPGSESEYVTSGMLRNTTGGFIQSGITGTFTWPTPTLGGGYTVGASAAPYSTIMYTGAVGTATQNLPAAPFDGQVVELVNGQASTWTALTVAVTDGSTTVNFGSALALAAGASAQFYYLKSTNSWYRMR
jgi:hypothetical protein